MPSYRLARPPLTMRAGEAPRAGDMGAGLRGSAGVMPALLRNVEPCATTFRPV